MLYQVRRIVRPSALKRPDDEVQRIEEFDFPLDDPSLTAHAFLITVHRQCFRRQNAVCIVQTVNLS